MYQIQGQLTCVTADGWQSSQQVPTLVAPLATSAREAASIVAASVGMLRDTQRDIWLNATVLDTDTGTIDSFKIKIGG